MPFYKDPCFKSAWYNITASFKGNQTSTNTKNTIVFSMQNQIYPTVKTITKTKYIEPKISKEINK